MATAFSALVNVQLNAQSLNTASREIRNSLGRITGASSEFQKSLDASTARVFAFGATTFVINGITQSFKALVGTTIEVEKRLIGISAIFGGTASEFQAFRDSIFDVAKKTGQSFSIVADGAEEFARQGLGAAETAKRLEAALVLTNISGLDSVKSVKTLTSAINGFSRAGLDAVAITNKIVAVDTKFAVSAQDLADGLSRAGSTAEDANVSFDELLGLITAVEQRTARGGAVIGNAFKSIFTRLSRSTTISELQELGVEINSSQSGVQKLQALSKALDQVSDPNKASQIKELAGGVYQINVVSAALKDLSDQNSVFANASKASAGATNEGFAKNAELMKSMSAQINGLIVGLTSMAEKVGQLTFAPLLKNLIGIASSVSEFLDKALDPEKGNAFIEGIFKAIGTFISGPGVVLITGAFIRIVSLVAKFAKEGFQSVMKIGSAEEKILNINTGITRELLENEKFRKAILDKTLTQEQKEQLINKTILDRNKLYNDQKMLLEAISRVALKSGVTGYESGVGYVNKKNKPVVKASGFAPSFAETAAETSAAREHGYKAGKVYNTRLYDGSGGSFKATVNSAETVKTVRGANGKLGTYVIPPNGFAGKGFVPNYATPKKVGDIARKGYSDFYDKDGKLKSKWMEKEVAENSDLGKFILSKKNAYAARDQNRVTLDANKYGIGMLVPNIRYTDEKTGHRGSFVKGKDRVPFTLENLAVRGPNVPNAIDQAANPKDELLKSNVYKKIIDESVKFGNLLQGSKLNRNKLAGQLVRNKGAIGAINSAVGSGFEAAVLAAYPEARFTDKETSLKNLSGGDFDVRGANGTFQKIFNTPKNLRTFDFKASASKSGLESMAKKIYSESAASRLPNKASGFVPNFASYVYDSDRIPADKGATLKAILASKAKKNLLIAPSGAGKSTAAAKYGKFLTGASDVSKASEINLLSGAARAKGGGMSKQLESLLDSVNASGGKVSYLHVKNMEIMKRRMGRASLEGDLRSEKQLKGTRFAPLNQFDFVKAVKSRAKRFEVLNAAQGFVPNFARKELGYGAFGTFSSLGKRKDGRETGVKSFRDDTGDHLIEKEWLTAEYLSKYVKSLSPNVFFPPNLSSYEFAMKKRKVLKPVISDPLAKDALRGQGLADPFGERFLAAAIEAASGVKIRDLHGGNYTVNAAAQEAIKAFDFSKSYSGQEAYAMLKGMTGAKFGAFDVGVNSLSETALKNLETIKKRQLAKKAIAKARGFIPNFSAVGDAIKREKAAGVPSSKIYLDSSPQLKSSRNPMGMMVANSIDEPKGGFQGINRARKEGRNPKTYGAAGGFVPNYAPVANRPVFTPRPITPQTPSPKFNIQLEDEAQKSVKDFSEKLNKGIEKTQSGLGKLNDHLGKTQGALFGLSVASSALTGDNEELAAGIQKVIAAVSVATVIGPMLSGLVPILANPLGLLAAAVVTAAGFIIHANEKLKAAQLEDVFVSNKVAKQKQGIEINQGILEKAISDTMAETGKNIGGQGLTGNDKIRSVETELTRVASLRSDSQKVQLARDAVKRQNLAKTNARQVNEEFSEKDARLKALKNKRGNDGAVSEEEKTLVSELKDITKKMDDASLELEYSMRNVAYVLSLSGEDLNSSLNKTVKDLNSNLSFFTSVIDKITQDLSGIETTSRTAGGVETRQGSPLGEQVAAAIKSQQNKVELFGAKNSFASSFAGIKGFNNAESFKGKDVGSKIAEDMAKEFSAASGGKELTAEEQAKIQEASTRAQNAENQRAAKAGIDSLKKNFPKVNSQGFQNEVLGSYSKDGLEGIKKSFADILPKDISKEQAEEFYNKIASSADLFLKASETSYQNAVNTESRIRDSLTNLAPQLRSAMKESLANLPSELKGILSGDNLDIGSLSAKAKEAGNLNKKGDKVGAAKILAEIEGQLANLDKLGGSSSALLESSGISLKQKESLIEAGQASKIDFTSISSSVEKALGENSFGSGQVNKAIKAAQGDPTKISNLIAEIQKQLGSGGNSGLSNQLTSGLSGFQSLEQQGKSFNQIESKILRAGSISGDNTKISEAIKAFKEADPDDNKAFEELKKVLEGNQGVRYGAGTDAANQLRGAAIAEKDRKIEEGKDPVKELETQQTQLNKDLIRAQEDVRKFGEIMAATGLKTEIDNMTIVVRKASENLNGFEKLTGQFSSLNDAIYGRMKNMEAAIRQLQGASPNPP